VSESTITREAREEVLSPAPAPNVIEVRDLRRRFGELAAVDGIDFDVREGEVFAFLGPNGAGKSTTINMLCTLLRPTSGRVTIAGFDVAARPKAVRRHIGLVFQEPTLDDRLTAQENLRFHAVLYRVPRDQVDRRIARVLELVDLSDRRYDLVSEFSGGMGRRLEIARALMHVPRVLFLDEPTVGLDPQTRALMWEDVLRLREEAGITVFLTTHYMDEAEYCDRIAIMDQGRIIVLDTPEALKAEVGKDRVQIQTDDDQAAIAGLRERFDIEATVAEGAVTFGVPEGGQFVPRLFDEWDPALPAIRSVSVARPSLDDVFMSHTGTTIRDAESGQTDTRRNFARMMNR